MSAGRPSISESEKPSKMPKAILDMGSPSLELLRDGPYRPTSVSVHHTYFVRRRHVGEMYAAWRSQNWSPGQYAGLPRDAMLWGDQWLSHRRRQKGAW